MFKLQLTYFLPGNNDHSYAKPAQSTLSRNESVTRQRYSTSKLPHAAHAIRLGNYAFEVRVVRGGEGGVMYSIGLGWKRQHGMDRKNELIFMVAWEVLEAALFSFI